MIPTFATSLTNRKLIYVLDMPSFQRDFASLKTLDHGTGPAITFTRASDATYFDANGVLQTASNDAPRFDHSGGSSLGLLIEEARTNSIRNSQAGGSISGSAGSPPTNWNYSGSVNGLTRTLSSGSVGGLSYIDVSFAGTATSAFSLFIDPEQATQIVASSAQVWTHSVYLALVAGSVPDCLVGVREGLADGTFLAIGTTNHSASLTANLQRLSHTRTLTEATTARATPVIRMTIANGATVSFTLRIAAPQLEQGAFPTSYIPTTTAAATRSADSAVVTPISSFYNQSEGTLFGEAQYLNSDASLISVDDGTGDNRMVAFIRQSSTTRLPALVRSSASDQSAFSNQAYADGFSRVILAYKANDLATTVNGLTVQTDTSATIPAVTTMRFGSNMNPAFMNGHIRKIAYYPKRLSNTLLQQLTT